MPAKDRETRIFTKAVKVGNQVTVYPFSSIRRQTLQDLQADLDEFSASQNLHNGFLSADVADSKEGGSTKPTANSDPSYILKEWESKKWYEDGLSPLYYLIYNRRRKYQRRWKKSGGSAALLTDEETHPGHQAPLPRPVCLPPFLFRTRNPDPYDQIYLKRYLPTDQRWTNLVRNMQSSASCAYDHALDVVGKLEEESVKAKRTFRDALLDAVKKDPNGGGKFVRNWAARDESTYTDPTTAEELRLKERMMLCTDAVLTDMNVACLSKDAFYSSEAKNSHVRSIDLRAARKCRDKHLPEEDEDEEDAGGYRYTTTNWRQRDGGTGNPARFILLPLAGDYEHYGIAKSALPVWSPYRNTILCEEFLPRFVCSIKHIQDRLDLAIERHEDATNRLYEDGIGTQRSSKGGKWKPVESYFHLQSERAFLEKMNQGGVTSLLLILHKQVCLILKAMEYDLSAFYPQTIRTRDDGPGHNQEMTDLIYACYKAVFNMDHDEMVNLIDADQYVNVRDLRYNKDKKEAIDDIERQNPRQEVDDRVRELIESEADEEIKDRLKFRPACTYASFRVETANELTQEDPFVPDKPIVDIESAEKEDDMGPHKIAPLGRVLLARKLESEHFLNRQPKPDPQSYVPIDAEPWHLTHYGDSPAEATNGSFRWFEREMRVDQKEGLETTTESIQGSRGATTTAFFFSTKCRFQDRLGQGLETRTIWMQEFCLLTLLYTGSRWTLSAPMGKMKSYTDCLPSWRILSSQQ